MPCALNFDDLSSTTRPSLVGARSRAGRAAPRRPHCLLVTSPARPLHTDRSGAERCGGKASAVVEAVSCSPQAALDAEASLMALRANAQRSAWTPSMRTANLLLQRVPRSKNTRTNSAGDAAVLFVCPRHPGISPPRIRLRGETPQSGLAFRPRGQPAQDYSHRRVRRQWFWANFPLGAWSGDLPAVMTHRRILMASGHSHA